MIIEFSFKLNIFHASPLKSVKPVEILLSNPFIAIDIISWERKEQQQQQQINLLQVVV